MFVDNWLLSSTLHNYIVLWVSLCVVVSVYFCGYFCFMSSHEVWHEWLFATMHFGTSLGVDVLFAYFVIFVCHFKHEFWRNFERKQENISTISQATSHCNKIKIWRVTFRSYLTTKSVGNLKCFLANWDNFAYMNRPLLAQQELLHFCS